MNVFPNQKFTANFTDATISALFSSTEVNCSTLEDNCSLGPYFPYLMAIAVYDDNPHIEKTSNDCWIDWNGV